MKYAIMLSVIVFFSTSRQLQSQSCNYGSNEIAFTVHVNKQQGSFLPSRGHIEVRVIMTRVVNSQAGLYQYEYIPAQQFPGSHQLKELNPNELIVYSAPSIGNFSSGTSYGEASVRFDATGSENSATPVFYLGKNNYNVQIESYDVQGNFISGRGFQFSIDSRHQQYPFAASGVGTSDMCFYWTGTVTENGDLNMNSGAVLYMNTSKNVNSGQSFNIEDFVTGENLRDLNQFRHPQQFKLRNLAGSELTDKKTIVDGAGSFLSTEKPMLKGGTYTYHPETITIGTEKFYTWSQSQDKRYKIVDDLIHGNLSFAKDIQGSYNQTYSLKLKNNLEGTGQSGGIVWFKDPYNSTDFVSQNASSVNGFEKTDAYYNFSFIDGNDVFQSYSVKAASTFTDANSITWQWVSGDFNPTTATDLVLTGNTTKTANYKGILTSNTSGWVQSGMENFNGTEAVLYPSMNELWLHIEESELGSLSKEIKVASASEQASRYSVVKNMFGTFVSYVNNQGKIILKKYDQFGSLVASADLNNSTLPSGVTPKIGVGGYWYTLPRGFDEPVFINNLYVLYQNGSSVKYKIFNPNDSVFPAGTWSSSGVLTGLSGGELQTATNGNYGYIFWFNGTNVYFCQLMDYFNSVFTASTNPTGGMIDYVSGAVDGYGNLNLVYSRYSSSLCSSSVFHRKVYTDNSLSNELFLDGSLVPYDVPIPIYYPRVLTAEGTNLLLEIGKSTSSSPNYIFWKSTGNSTHINSWTKQSWSATPYAVGSPKKLLHGKTEKFPKEIAVSGLYRLQPTTLNMSNPSYLISSGERDKNSAYFSIVAQSLTDTKQFYIDLDPQTLDSIVVDTLGQWSLVLTDQSKLSELSTDLSHWGKTSLSEENKTVSFFPDSTRYYVYTMDPSNNLARMNVVSLDGVENQLKARAETDEVKENKVSVSPNPFNPQTQIRVQVKDNSSVRLEIYTLTGQLVFSEKRDNIQSQTNFNFNAQNLSSGTYFYRVYIGTDLLNGRLQLVK